MWNSDDTQNKSSDQRNFFAEQFTMDDGRDEDQEFQFGDDDTPDDYI